VADLACGGEPVVDPAPYRFERPMLTAVEAGTW